MVVVFVKRAGAAFAKEVFVKVILEAEDFVVDIADRASLNNKWETPVSQITLSRITREQALQVAHSDGSAVTDGVLLTSFDTLAVAGICETAFLLAHILPPPILGKWSLLFVFTSARNVGREFTLVSTGVRSSPFSLLYRA